MDITFNCGWCGQSIAIDEAGAGQLVDCPKCGKPLEVPHRSKPPAVPASPSVSDRQHLVSTKMFALSFFAAGVAVLIAGIVFYVAVVNPLQVQVEKLTDTVNHNAEVANRETTRLGVALDSLTDTVNHNAEAANRATAELGDALDSLTRTVNRNADALDSLTRTVNRNAEIENYNNSLR
jgi:methyl-accepting chemotaxis protein